MEQPRDLNCVFCKIVAGDIPCAKVLETDEALAFLDIGPLAKGHTLLIPKVHVTALADMNAASAGAVLRHLPALARAVKAATDCPGYNILQNNGRVAHQAVFHVHFHIIPRYEDGQFHFNWPAGEYKEGELEALQEKILAELER